MDLANRKTGSASVKCPPGLNGPRLTRRARLTDSSLLVVVGFIFIAIFLAGTGTPTVCLAACPEGTCDTDCCNDYWRTYDQRWRQGDLPVPYYINQNGAADCVGDEFKAVQRLLPTGKMHCSATGQVATKEPRTKTPARILSRPRRTVSM